jgi:AcrR family transcriptional regulator
VSAACQPGDGEPGDGEPGAPEATCGTATWWRDRYLKRQRQRRRALDLDQICAQALRIVDADGLAALTMRSLAEALGTGPASLYRHVASREELIEELADVVLGDVTPPPLDVSWRLALEHLARQTRDVLVSHRGVALAASSGPYLGPNGLRLREHFFTVMHQAGWSPDMVLRAHMAIMHLVVSSARFTAAARDRRSSRWKEDLGADLAGLLAVLPPGTLPMVDRLGPRTSGIDLDADFSFALGCVLDGLAARFG